MSEEKAETGTETEAVPAPETETETEMVTETVSAPVTETVSAPVTETVTKTETVTETVTKTVTVSGTESEPGSETKAAPASERVIRLLGDDGETLWVRRKIVVFRRLEPSDVRSPGSHTLEESPYLEATLVELALPKGMHDEMRALASKRARTLDAASGLFRSYDPAGWLLAAGGGGLVGVWLDYIPHAFLWALVGIVAVGVVLGFGTRNARATAEREADQRWRASPEKKEYDLLAKELAEAWARAQATLKREAGFHTVIRVAEGSVDPLRLASIDPRPYAADPPSFDPDDFLPSEDGGAVRYEQVHATGEVVTQALAGTQDLRES